MTQAIGPCPIRSTFSSSKPIHQSFRHGRGTENLWSKEGYVYERVMVPTLISRAEARSTRIYERRMVDIIKMKCLQSICDLTRMGKRRNEEVMRRIRDREKMSRSVSRKVFKCFGPVERMGGER